MLGSLGLAAAAGPRQSVSEADLGAAWPLVVKSGTLACEILPEAPQLEMVTFTDPSGNTFALNGIAASRASKRGWFPVDSIWKNNPAIPGTKIPISSLIKRGAALCKR